MRNGNGDDIETEVERLTKLLTGYITHVPPKVCNGSYNLAVEFKAAVARCKKLIGKRGVKAGELNSAVNTMHRYWE